MKKFYFEDQFTADEPAGQLEATNAKLITIGEAARKCLASADFQQYKEMFDKELAGIMNAMVVYTANYGKQGDSLEVYALNMIRFVQRITDLRKLITYVELDARKGSKTKEENDGKV